MRKRSLLFYVVFIFGSSLFAIKGFTWDMGLPKFYFASVMISILIIFLGMKAVRSPWELSMAFPQIIALMLAAYSCLTTLLLLESLPEVFPVSLGYAMNFLLFVVFSVLISKDSGDKLLIFLQIFIVAGLVIALDALFAFYSGTSLLWGTESAPLSRGNLASVIGNVNFTTDLMGMLLLPVAFLVVTKKPVWKRETLRRVFYLVVFSVLLVVILIGQTRSVYYSVIGSLIFVVLFSTVLLIRFRPKGVFTAFSRLFLLLLLLVTVAVVWTYSGDNFLTQGSFSFSERLTYTFEDSISVDSRLLQWEAALEQWKGSKVLGTGFGSYKYFSTENMGVVLATKPQYMYAAGLNSIRAHNEYTQMLGETGVVGLSLVFLFIFSMAIHSWKVVSRTDSPKNALEYLFLVAGLLILFIDTILSFTANLMTNALLGVFLFGFAMRREYYGGRRLTVKFGGAVSLIAVVFSLGTSVLMSRNFISEGLFTRGYIAYKNLENINPQIPGLLESISSIKVEKELLQNFTGTYTALATDTYVTSRENRLRERYPVAPERLLHDMAVQEQELAYKSAQSQLDSRLRAASSALMNARQDGNENFYRALRNLALSRELSPGQYMADVYFGYLYLTAQRKEDFRLKLSMSQGNLEAVYREIFSREDAFSAWLNDSGQTGGLLNEISLDHAFLRNLPDAIFHTVSSTDLQSLLDGLDSDLLIDFQLSLDAIDALLRSLSTAPDLQVVRNTASLLFRVMIDSSGVSAELKEIVPILKDPATLNGIIADLDDLSSSHRREMVALYEAAIANSPGSWLKDDPNIYEEYSRNLLMVYGEGELAKVLEIAESELFAWSYMKSQNVVPDGVLKVLRSFKEDLKIGWVEALYGEAAAWCEERIAFLKLELENQDIPNVEREKLNVFLRRADGFIKLYKYFLE